MFGVRVYNFSNCVFSFTIKNIQSQNSYQQALPFLPAPQSLRERLSSCGTDRWRSSDRSRLLIQGESYRDRSHRRGLPSADALRAGRNNKAQSNY